VRYRRKEMPVFAKHNCIVRISEKAPVFPRFAIDPDASRCAVHSLPPPDIQNRTLDRIKNRRSEGRGISRAGKTDGDKGDGWVHGFVEKQVIFSVVMIDPSILRHQETARGVVPGKRETRHRMIVETRRVSNETFNHASAPVMISIPAAYEKPARFIAAEMAAADNEVRQLPARIVSGR
jgi:hypothetical protein